MNDASLYAGDATDVLPSVEQADLTVTSPPYLDAIDYDDYDGTRSSDYTERDGERLDKWKEMQRKIFQDVYDATTDGGYCAVVIGDVIDQNDEFRPIASHFATMMDELGWTFQERISWAKPTGGSSRFGVFVQHPHPTYYYPNRQSEQIQIWSKGDGRTEKRDDHTVEIDGVMKKEVANDVWHVAPVPPNKASTEHPCPFPEELVHRLVTLYTYPGETVLDPMMGAGTTPFVADALDRNAIGIDIREQYVEAARERLSTEYERGNVVVPEYPTVKTDRNPLIR